MAITHIHAITGSPNRAINYAVGHKADKYRDGIIAGVNYAMNDKTGEVTYETIRSYVNTNCGFVQESFARSEVYYKATNSKVLSLNKDGEENVAWHLIQSFEGYEVDPITANEIGRRLAEELFSKYPCVIGTHTNTEDIHNHIVFSAYGDDGRKYNDCLDTYRAIRHVSDKLCREYGLKVLEHTQDMMLYKYKDKDGVTRYYEPTERKNAIIATSEKGEIPGGIDDYMNTPQFSTATQEKAHICDIVKCDIDILLPIAVSYDDLLDRLRDLGYTIRDKKKDGGWLKHVSFKPPNADKPIRDGYIGNTDVERDFYMRENLTRYIEDRQAEIEAQRSADVADVRGLPYFESYSYPDVDVNSIGDRYRLKKSSDDNYERVERSPVEQDTIGEIRRLDAEMKDALNLSQINALIEQQRHEDISGRHGAAKRREAVLVKEIQDNFRALEFMERNDIYSFQQINDMYSNSLRNYTASIHEMERLEYTVEQMNTMIDLMPKEEQIGDRVAKLNADLAKHGLNTVDSIDSMKERLINTESKMDSLKEQLLQTKERLIDYENCIGVISKMATDDRAMYADISSSFISTKEQMERQAEATKQPVVECKAKKPDRGYDR